MAGRHRKGAPQVSPDGIRDWLDSAEGGAEVRDAAWAAAVDWAEDGHLSDPARDRLVRAGRTLLQGSAGAALVAAGLAYLPWDVPPAVIPVVTAVLTALLSLLHTKRK